MVLCFFIASFSPIHHPSAFSHSTSPASCPENRCDYSSCVFWCRCRNDSSPWLWCRRTGTWLAPSPWISHRQRSRFPLRRCHIPFLQGQRHCRSISLMVLILMILAERLLKWMWSHEDDMLLTHALAFCGQMQLLCAHTKPTVPKQSFIWGIDRWKSSSVSAYDSAKTACFTLVLHKSTTTLINSRYEFSKALPPLFLWPAFSKLKKSVSINMLYSMLLSLLWVCTNLMYSCAHHLLVQYICHSKTD